MNPIYEIRRSGATLCASHTPNLGYGVQTLRDMERNGLYLYCDGKKVKSRSGVASTRSGKGNISISNISNQRG